MPASIVHAAAQATCALAGQGSDHLGKLALEVIVAVLIGGVAQYVGWRALGDHWKALLVSVPTVVGAIYLLRDLFN
ncbi:hypothetical protein ACQP2Y_14890 [Actinoplanes sp. CA-051413]|uniref:hypothetical protein n=1 Tax=Actinoplanes sp. CA-051413 TaxID=3239899 RepID=UPI003D9944A4